MKRAPLKILLIILITGLLCVGSECLLAYQLERLEDMHQKIMDEYVENREYMAEINKLLYQHQTILANHLLTTDQEMRDSYLAQEMQLRQKITECIINFSYRMKVGEREQIYHKVYSDYAGYDTNVDLVFQFSKNDERDMAIYYNDNVLKPFLENIDSNLEDLDAMTEAEITEAEKEIRELMKMAEIMRYTIIAAVIILLIFCIVICVRITYNLDHYKEKLETELKEKERVLRKHTEAMLHIQDGIIYGMANLIESRDGETGEHVKRTSAYVEMIALAAREQGVYSDTLTDEYIEMLKKVAPLHDVGKIAVPDHILLKPGKLTEEEFDQIKQHVVRGGEIIRDVFENIEDQAYVNMAEDVAKYHHEKWDGEGYMEHLAGERIPLSARIMALADVFDALISKRRYESAFDLDKSFSIMEESAGSHFDPKLVKVFLSIRPEIENYLIQEGKQCEQTHS